MTVQDLPKAKRKIALVVPAFEIAGGVPVVADFILRVIASRSDLEVVIISLAMGWRDPASTRLTNPLSWFSGVRTFKGAARGWSYTHVGSHLGEIEMQRVRPRKALDKLLRDCDIIQLVAGVPAWTLAVAEAGKPVVAAVATLNLFDRRRAVATRRGLLGPWRNLMARQSVSLDDRGLRAADAVMVMNPTMLAYAREATANTGALVRYAPPGLDSAHFHPLTSGEACEGYILSVARFDDPRKNVSMLLEAYIELRKQMDVAPDLVLAGAYGPPEEFWVRARAAGVASHVRFVERPSHDALAEIYRRAYVFVLASDEEGFGLVVIEAMASGIPVVATRCGGPDGIVEDGVDGYLVERHAPTEITERLLKLYRDPPLARAMGMRAREKVERQYSDDAAGRVFLDTYDELLTAKTRI